MTTPNDGRLPDDCGEGVQLTLEEQFQLTRFPVEIANLNLEQAKTLLIQIHGLMVAQTATYRAAMRQSLGVSNAPKRIN